MQERVFRVGVRATVPILATKVKGQGEEALNQTETALGIIVRRSPVSTGGSRMGFSKYIVVNRKVTRVSEIADGEGRCSKPRNARELHSEGARKLHLWAARKSEIIEDEEGERRRGDVAITEAMPEARSSELNGKMQ
jgi:hypothetical protein